MQWLINIIQEWALLNIGYVYRGDPAAVDFAVGDFNQNGAWNVLTLPAIVPIAARAVHLEVVVQSGAVNRAVLFKRAGNANDINHAQIRTHIANFRHAQDFSISMESGTRDIEYLTSVAAFTRIDLAVKGWWM